MGLLDWFRGTKKAKGDKVIAPTPSPPADVPTASKAPDASIDALKRALDAERARNIEQEERIKDMERRFAEVQGNFVMLMQKQTKTMELMLERSERSRADEVKKDAPKEALTVQDAPPAGKEQDRRLVTAPARPKKPSTEGSYDYGAVLRDKTFQNFVVDESNRFAYLATEAVATGVGRKYNPLFVYGPPGVGKTHLLHALANKMKENDPDLRLIYSSTEIFTDELIAALETGDLSEFRRKYHDTDVLLIDDIQTLSGKENTQVEFFHLFNHLYNLQKQIVLCSDRPPNEIKELESRLRSRFEGGLIIDINLPTFEGRRQILFNMANRAGISLSNEVMDYMAYYLDSNVRELEGGFNRVTAYAGLMKETITITLVRKVLEGVLLKPTEGAAEAPGIPEDALEVERAPAPKVRSRTSTVLDEDLNRETDQIERELLQELMKDTTHS